MNRKSLYEILCEKKGVKFLNEAFNSNLLYKFSKSLDNVQSITALRELEINLYDISYKLFKSIQLEIIELAKTKKPRDYFTKQELDKILCDDHISELLLNNYFNRQRERYDFNVGEYVYDVEVIKDIKSRDEHIKFYRKNIKETIHKSFYKWKCDEEAFNVHEISDEDFREYWYSDLKYNSHNPIFVWDDTHQILRGVFVGKTPMFLITQYYDFSQEIGKEASVYNDMHICLPLVLNTPNQNSPVYNKFDDARNKFINAIIARTAGSIDENEFKRKYYYTQYKELQILENMCDCVKRDGMLIIADCDITRAKYVYMNSNPNRAETQQFMDNKKLLMKFYQLENKSLKKYKDSKKYAMRAEWKKIVRETANMAKTNIERYNEILRNRTKGLYSNSAINVLTKIIADYKDVYITTREISNFFLSCVADEFHDDINLSDDDGTFKRIKNRHDDLIKKQTKHSSYYSSGVEELTKIYAKDKGSEVLSYISIILSEFSGNFMDNSIELIRMLVNDKSEFDHRKFILKYQNLMNSQNQITEYIANINNSIKIEDNDELAQKFKNALNIVVKNKGLIFGETPNTLYKIYKTSQNKA